ncbi:hypothetical protein HMF7854_03925 [Sphingomonas ginkgonis]|uniref:Permease n=1 Tax=Sphingomonas ginkgonis TaxID=2315330 RepID=A0A429V808_9SPHN|nr:hypothetical protein [Sphingomonas ginkgonis]RST30069.1 hypothetical protein HMF7854_03925 [Sphingomonas ginkgonis]
MDFMKWLNSLGELLYEVMSWLIFYPITLWRSVTHPLRMMAYADSELHDRQTEQFTDTLNPPLFLILSLLLTQEIDEALGGGVNPIVAKQTGLAALITDSTTLLALRLVLFSLFPLMMSARLLRAQGTSLTRQCLKPPFYAQCYACAPFALVLGIGVSLGHVSVPHAGLASGLLSILSVTGYLAAETLWFSRRLNQPVGRGLLHALRAFFTAAVLAIAIGALFVVR